MDKVLLICDDSKMYLQAMKRAFFGKYYVITACSGYEAISFASLYNPDLIILDVVIYGMTGFDAARKLKANALTKDIPIIFITAHSEDTHKEEGMAIGAIDYLTKPLDLPILIEKIGRYFNE